MACMRCELRFFCFAMKKIRETEILTMSVRIHPNSVLG